MTVSKGLIQLALIAGAVIIAASGHDGGDWLIFILILTIF